MSEGYPWIKLHTRYLDDSRLMQLSEVSICRYFQLYLMAARADAGGLLCEGDKVLSINEIGWRLRIDGNSLESDLDDLVQAGLLKFENNGWILTLFADEQGPSQKEQREKWRERQAKHRANALKTEEELEKELEKEIDIDKDKEIEKRKSEIVTHDGVTDESLVTTNTSTPNSSMEEIYLSISQSHPEINPERLREACNFYYPLAIAKRWRPDYSRTILELCDPEKLTEMKRRYAECPSC